MKLKEIAKGQYAKRFKKAIDEGNSIEMAEFIATRYVYGFMEGFIEGYATGDKKKAEVIQEYKEAIKEFARYLK